LVIRNTLLDHHLAIGNQLLYQIGSLRDGLGQERGEFLDGERIVLVDVLQMSSGPRLMGWDSAHVESMPSSPYRY